MSEASWTLSQTLAALPVHRVFGSLDRSMRMRSLVTDSRDATADSLFCALPGTRDDGSRYVRDAIASGSVAVVSEHRVEGLDVPLIVVPDARNALARIAATWYGDPSPELCLIGVTGTNGKTTTVHLISVMSETGGYTAGTIGTLGVTCGGAEVPVTSTRPTTPEAHELRQMLAQLERRGASLVSMEVTSHGLVLDRVWGLHFKVAVFTNLTTDHLDFHGSMEEYFRSKSLLFTEQQNDDFAVINIDDPWGRKLTEIAAGKVITYACEREADICPVSLTGGRMISGTVATPAGPVHLDMPLAGQFNIENALAAVGAGIALGLSTEQIGDGLSRAQPLPGRFEPVSAGQEFSVIVDYAHTPDALENVLVAARSMASGRVLCAFGCGGDRDRKKRPEMGGISTRLADFTVFTSDNPRTEDPEAIIDDIVAGVRNNAAYERIESRAQAIRRVIDMAQAGDVVVIAGKGHEPYQEIGTTRIPYDDRIEARKALEERFEGHRQVRT